MDGFPNIEIIHVQIPPRVMGSDAARAVGRFDAGGPRGYRAATAPDAPLRPTRAEAVADEEAWLERRLG